MSEYTTSNDETIECPACRATLKDLWEHFVGHDTGADIECDECGVRLDLQRNVTVDYTCRVVDRLSEP